MYGLSEDAGRYVDLKYRRRLQTLASVDDMVEAVVQKLQERGQLDNTFIIYTSDNGYHLGDYGTVYDKRQPWETDTHVPLIIRGPGIPKNVTSHAVASMVDVTATLLALAGVKQPTQIDGTSLLPFVTGAGSPRAMALVEYVGESDGGGAAGGVCARTHGQALYCDVAGAFPLPPYWDGPNLCVCQDATNNTYSCLRAANGTANFRYCEFVDGDGTVEYFDYASDPHELVNLASTLAPAVRASLHTQLRAAVGCVGAAQCNAILSLPVLAPSS